MRGEGEAAVFLDVGQEESIGINKSRCIVDAGDIDGLSGDGVYTLYSMPHRSELSNCDLSLYRLD